MSTTTTPTMDHPVGELVAQQPGRSRVFDEFGIDYCCGGRKPLAEACREKGVDAAQVLARLRAADEAPPETAEDWSRASLTELADHIEQTHHVYLKRELPRLGGMVRKVAAVHGESHPWLLELDGVYAGFQGELESHTLKEEQVLFPLIRQLESGAPGATTACGHGIAAPIEVMEHEHDDAGAAIQRMRDLSSGFTPPADACNTFRAMLDGLRELEADLHTHVHKENNILFPRALELT